MTACNTSSISYFATTNFLSQSLHIMSYFEVPTHLFGAYIIIFKTPSNMSSVKWPMLNLHFWSSMLDVFWSSLANPFVLFPYFAGNGIGILSRFGLDTAIQVYVAITAVEG
uniref:Uncharacterized protein n=1 Tax=Caenorhabditis japonica TaxID=281687 RepID=A0A8R1E8L5_CAEJA